MSQYMDDLESWMGLLPEKLRKISVIYLSIPGSHNSMTYGITSKSGVAPDADKTIQRVNKVLPCVVRRWAITQKKNIEEQLKSGVRFFDLRIVANKSTFYFAHGLYSFKINNALWQIRLFLDEHPRELVILDFQHFYNFGEKDHMLLQTTVRNIFSPKIYDKNDGPLTNCSLHKAEKLGRQVIIIYRRTNTPNDMWAGHYWPTPWPDTDNTTKLREFLDKTLQNREPYEGFVSQCIITPTPKYILPRVFSSLKSAAVKVDKHLSDWIKEQRPGPFYYREKPRVNVFLGDFVDIKHYEFCKLVIGLNKYLEREI